jgi:hypothetical protein
MTFVGRVAAGIFIAVVTLVLVPFASALPEQTSNGENPYLAEPLTVEGRAQENALVQALNVPDPQAVRDVQVQRSVGNLNGTLERTLGSTYADVWFDPWHARFDVGVAPSTAQHESELRSIIADHGLSGVTSLIPVGSTYGELVSAKVKLDSQLRSLTSSQHARTKIDASGNSVILEVDGDFSAEEVQSLTAALGDSGVTIMVKTVPVQQLVTTADTTFSPCTFEASVYDLCNPPLLGGVQIFSTGQIIEGEPYYRVCTAGFLATSKFPTSYPDHYLLTAGHCFMGDEVIEDGSWYSAEHEANGATIGTMAYHYISEEGDAAFIDLNEHTSYWEDAPSDAVPSFVYTPGQAWSAEPTTEDYEIARVGENDPENIEYQVPCHSGWGSGVHCGVTEATDVTTEVNYSGEGGGTKRVGNLVENSACGAPGDSGGPWIFDHYAMGLMVSTSGTCEEGGGPSFFDDQHTADVLMGMRVVGAEGPSE